MTNKDTNQDDFLRYLLTTTCKPSLHIPVCKRVLTCKEDEALPSAFRMLTTANVTSAPVVDSWHRYIGFVDLSQMVHFVSCLFYGNTTEEWVNFWDTEQRFLQATVADVMKYGQRREMCPPCLSVSFSTFRCLETMVVNKQHRLAVTNSTNMHIVGLVTQSMLISELGQRLHLCSPVLRALKVRNIMTPRVVAVQERNTALSALHSMVAQGVGSVAMLNQNDELTGVLSARDLKGVGASGKHFHRLFLSAKEYKRMVLEQQPELAPKASSVRKEVPRSPVWVSPNQSFEDVVNRMSDGNLHHIFVVDLQEKSPRPVGVVSQSDILRVLWLHYTGKSKVPETADVQRMVANAVVVD